MKLIFSEFQPRYGNYTFPYVVWAIPENSKEIASLYAQGFLPSTKPKFYLTRSTRISLKAFQTSYSNRRALKKSEHINLSITKSENFNLSADHITLCMECAANRFGDGVVDEHRLHRIFSSENCSHIMSFSYLDQTVGLVTVNVLEDIAHYNFAFHDITKAHLSIGTFMLTSAVKHFQDLEFSYLYMGTCYSKNFLYKSKFKGFEFFNGTGWSGDLAELEYLISDPDVPTHLLESQEYLHKFPQQL